MSWIWQWVVLIASRKEKGYKPLGTGALVAPGRIVTARHVVLDGEGKPQPDLAVRREGTSEFLAATIVWPGSAELDVAVLEVAIHAAGPRHCLVALSGRDIDVNEPWEAKGYPVVDEDRPNSTLKAVRGATCSCQKGSRDFPLDVGARPDDLRGASGAPVVVGGHVVGIMRAVPENWSGTRLSATPVAACFVCREFRDALGLTPEDEQIDSRVSRVLDGAASLLEKRPHVVAALLRGLQITARPGVGAQAVASEFVHSRLAIDVAKVLNHVDAELAKSAADVEDRLVVRSLLWQILPFAIDWRQLVAQCLSTLSGGRNCVELPLLSATVAEVVVAGIDDRCCKFAPPAVGAMPVGAALVRLPAAAQTALFDRDGSRLAQLIVQQLSAEAHVEAYARYDDMRDAVEGTLRYHAREAPDDEILPYYLLFVDADLGGKESEHDLWALARSVIGEELPSLKLVRLTGGLLKEETVIAKHLEAICRRPL